MSIHPTLRWLLRSIEKNGGNGSSACYHLWRGWALPYPETTGYIIETLWDWHHYGKYQELRKAAIACTDWLLGLQRKEGSFPGGVGVGGRPLVFDTGMILFGLVRSWQETRRAEYLDGAARALTWLSGELAADGSWPRHNYVAGYNPAYNVRVVWACLAAAREIGLPGMDDQMRKALTYYRKYCLPDGTFQNWGLRPDEPALTHTLAYIIRGWLECGELLDEKEMVQVAGRSMDALIERKRSGGHFSIAGQYRPGWEGDYHFICPTGHAQLLLAALRLFDLTRQKSYLDFAHSLWKEIKNLPAALPLRGIRGGIPGSYPWHGPYQRFAFPNWTAKFYLDAWLAIKTLTDDH